MVRSLTLVRKDAASMTLATSVACPSRLERLTLEAFASLLPCAAPKEMTSVRERVNVQSQKSLVDGLITNQSGEHAVPRLLTDGEVAARLKRLPGWRRKGRYITKTFRFEEFPAGIAFVERIAGVAETLGHHPDIHIVYTSVRLAVQTHSAGGITVKDFELASAIEEGVRGQGPGR